MQILVQILVSIGLVVTELCCHKLNMNTKEKHIIQSILNFAVFFLYLSCIVENFVNDVKLRVVFFFQITKIQKKCKA